MENEFLRNHVLGVQRFHHFSPDDAPFTENKGTGQVLVQWGRGGGAFKNYGFRKDKLTLFHSKKGSTAIPFTI